MMFDGLCKAKVIRKNGIIKLNSYLYDNDPVNRFTFGGDGAVMASTVFKRLSDEDKERVAPRFITIYGHRYYGRNVSGRKVRYRCSDNGCPGSVSFDITLNEEGFEHKVIDVNSANLIMGHNDSCRQRQLNLESSTQSDNNFSMENFIPYIDRHFESERDVSKGLLMLDTLVDERDEEILNASESGKRVIFRDIHKKSIKEGCDWGTLSSSHICNTLIRSNWVSKYSGMEEYLELDLDKDIKALEDVVRVQQDADLQDINGMKDGVSTHCMGRCPIDIAYQSKEARKAGENGVNIVPRKILPEQYHALHSHIGKRERHGTLGDPECVWFNTIVNGEGSGLDTVRFATKHNWVKREPFAEFTICVLDVMLSWKMRSLRINGLPAFHGIDDELKVKRVYVVACGPNGTFSENGAYIKLVRDNYDMKREIVGKKWTVESMKSAEV
eukprot:scaffold85108_cov59-Cyclotella_meneghiniana.AAC.1